MPLAIRDGSLSQPDSRVKANIVGEQNEDMVNEAGTKRVPHQIWPMTALSRLKMLGCGAKDSKVE